MEWVIRGWNPRQSISLFELCSLIFEPLKIEKNNDAKLFNNYINNEEYSRDRSDMTDWIWPIFFEQTGIMTSTNIILWVWPKIENDQPYSLKMTELLNQRQTDKFFDTIYGGMWIFSFS